VVRPRRRLSRADRRRADAGARGAALLDPGDAVPAADEEAAYRKAVEEAANESDVNFDGPGHRNLYYTLGLHELEEYANAADFAADLERRGVWVTSFDPTAVDAAGVPRVRAKQELEVFRLRRPPGDASART
jgi:hypothetical protein